ncbi:MAG: oligosaccharide flippase family protein [Eubacteriales bacterium]|nr:oligosaccharide flippase family protein [Eubacteriales bacterium]
MHRTQRFLWNGTVTAVSSLLLRGIGMGFQVYLSRMLGAGGIGLFSLVMSVYTLAVTFAASGINLGATRIIAEERGKQNENGVSRALHSALCYAAIFGGAAAIFLLIGSHSIGVSWLQDVRTVSPLRLLALSLPPLAFANVCNGYFTACRSAYKNAILGITCECVRMGTSILLLRLWLHRGTQYACLALAGGNCAAEVSDALLCAILLIYARRSERRKAHSRTNTAQTTAGVTRRLLRVSLPIACTAYVRSALLTLEHILIPLGLRQSGDSAAQALAAYGTVHGMVLPAILYPMAFLSAFAALLVPELAEYHVRGDNRAILRLCSRGCKITLLFGIGVCGVFLCCAPLLGHVLYDSQQAGYYLHALGILTPLMYLDHIVDAMLKGLDEQLASMRYNILDAALCVLAVYFLLPRFGIRAYLWILIGSELFNLSLSVSRLLRVVRMPLHPIRQIALPVLCSVAAQYVACGIMHFCEKLFSYGFWSLFFLVCTSLTVYTAFLRLCGCIGVEDLAVFCRLFRKKDKPQRRNAHRILPHF